MKRMKFLFLFAFTAVMFCGASFASELADDMTIAGNFARGYTVNNWYSQYVTVSGGTREYTFNITDGELPPGFFIRQDAAYFYLEGIPNTAGTWKFTLRVTDRRDTYAERNLSVTIDDTNYKADDMNLSEAFTASGETGKWYESKIQTKGGTQDYTFNVTGTLPPGLYVRQSGSDFYLQGVPTQTGDYTFTLRVTDRRNSYTEISSTVKITAGENYKDPSEAEDMAITGDLPTGRRINEGYSGGVYLTGYDDGTAWSIVDGSLPPGLSLSGGRYNCTIYGIPNAGGTYRFTLRAVARRNVYIDRQFVIKINGSPFEAEDMSITDNFTTNKMINESYSSYVHLNGYTDNVTWTLAEGTLPPGLSLRSGNYYIELYGIPNTGGTYTFTLRATDSRNSYVERPFTVKINDTPFEAEDMSITGDFTTGTRINDSYYGQVNVNGYEGNVYWTLADGALPDGLSLRPSGSTAYIRGIPNKGGTYTFTLRATDSRNAYIERQFLIKINDTPYKDDGMSITGDFDTGKNVSESYYSYVSASSYAGSIYWTHVSGALPDGLSLRPDGRYAYIRGIPNKPGTYKFTLRATDTRNAYTEREFSITINGDEPSAPSSTTDMILSGVFPEGYTVNTWYSSYIQASGGESDYTFKITGGTLPPGFYIRQDGRYFHLEGIPNTAGTYTFKLRVIDKRNTYAEREFTVNINSSHYVTTDMSLAGKFPDAYTINPWYSNRVEATGGVTDYTFNITAGSLPPGFYIRQDGRYFYLEGIPNAPGTYTFSIRVTDRRNAYTERSFTMSIKGSETPTPEPTDPVTIITSSLPNGKEGESYSASISVTGDSSIGLTWVITGLPDGLSYTTNGKTCTISGKPTAAGNYTVRVNVANTETEDTRDFTLKISGGDDDEQEITFNGHKYRIYNDSMTWDEAKAYCESLGGHLVTITSQEEQNVVASLVSSGNKWAYWLGAEKSSGAFEWVTGETFSYTNFAENQPDDSGICLQMYGTHPDEEYLNYIVLGHWDDTPSDANSEKSGNLTLEHHGFICEWDGNSNNENEKIYNGHRYRIYPDGMTWTEAKAYCESLGGHLATITSQEEQNIVASLVLSGDKNSYWLGGQKDSADNWSWIDGSTWSYTNWASGEPNYDWEDKLMMYRLSDPATYSVPATWNNLPDNGTNEEFFALANLGFVCEWDSSNESDAITITTDSLKEAVTGEAYSQTLSADGTVTSWKITSGDLPEGLTLDESTGTISGTISENAIEHNARYAKDYTFEITASNSSSSSAKNLTISVSEPIKFITDSTLPNAKAGKEYTATIEIEGTYLHVIAWVIKDMPGGLNYTYSGRTCTISGTPETEGTYTLKANAGNTRTEDFRNFTLIVESAPETVEITTSSLIVAETGKEYTQTLSATGSPTSWKITDGKLPEGLTLDEATGVISGTTLESAIEHNADNMKTYTFEVTAANASGESAVKTLAISVVEPIKFITESVLPGAVAGREYKAAITVSGTMRTNITWLVVNLPAGIEPIMPEGLTYTTNGRTCTISGTPEKAGDYVLRVSAATVDTEATQNFTLTVDPKPIPLVKPQITVPKGLGILIAGINYSFQFTATGTSPITWSAEGSIPPGFTFDTSTGILSGTLERTDEGKSSFLYMPYTFTVKASNRAGTDSAENGVSVWYPPEIVTGSTLPEATVNNSYNETITAEGTEFSMAWKKSSGNIPAGLKLTMSKSKRSCTLTGTPTKAGTYSFALTLSNVVGLASTTTTKTFTITVNKDPGTDTGKPEITTDTLPEGETGAAYVVMLEASGQKPITWSKSGSFPKGLKLDKYGTIAGVPTKPGTYTFTLRAKNRAGTVSQKFTVTIAGETYTKPKITTKKITEATMNQSYSVQLECTGSEPVIWSFANTKYPAGLYITEDGLIAGTPKEAGKFSLKVRADNNIGSAVKSYSLKVNGAAPSIVNEEISEATVKEEYSEQLEAEGTAPITWSKSGKFPSGLKLNTKTGEITGTPKKAGVYTFKVTAKSKYGKDTRTFTMYIWDEDASESTSTPKTETQDSQPEITEYDSAEETQNYALAEEYSQAEIFTENDAHNSEIDMYVVSGDEELRGEIYAPEGKPLTFVIGTWPGAVKDSDIVIFIADEAVELEADDNTFTLPGELVKDEFVIYAKAGDMKTIELYVVAETEEE